MNARTSAAAALVVCAASDAAAVPHLLGSDDVPTGVGIGVAVLAALTFVAALGLARLAGGARRLAVATRVLDLAAALPVLAGGASESVVAAATATVVLSGAALLLLVRTSTAPVAS